MMFFFSCACFSFLNATVPFYIAACFVKITHTDNFTCFQKQRSRWFRFSCQTFETFLRRNISKALITAHTTSTSYYNRVLNTLFRYKLYCSKQRCKHQQRILVIFRCLSCFNSNNFIINSLFIYYDSGK